MNTPIETLEYKGIDIEIHHDTYPQNPWEEWDLLSQIKDFTSRNNGFLRPEKHFSERRLAYEFFGENGVYTEVNIDRGQRFLFIPLSKLKEECPKLSKKELKKKGHIILKGDAKLYRQWADGEVYGFNTDHPLCTDSSWGYYGYDHEKSGLLEDAWDFINTALAQEKEAQAFEKSVMAL